MSSAIYELFSFTTPLTGLSIIVFKMSANIRAFLNMAPYCCAHCTEKFPRLKNKNKKSLLSLSNRQAFILWMGFPGGSVVTNTPTNEGDLSLIPESGRPLEGGHGSPLQFSCLGNPMDRGAWQTIVHEIKKESNL